MIIWKGYGILVLVIAVAFGAITAFIFGEAGSNQDMGAAVGALISAVVIWFVGKKINSPGKEKTLVDKQTGKEVHLKPEHSMFFIKMQYWAFIIGAAGIYMLVTVYKNGKL